MPYGMHRHVKDTVPFSSELKMNPTEPITIYASRAKDIQAQMSAAGDEVKDQEVAMQFLAGLPPAYGM